MVAFNTFVDSSSSHRFVLLQWELNHAFGFDFVLPDRVGLRS